MPEGPSIVLAKEALRPLIGLTVKTAEGNTKKVDIEKLSNTRLKSVRSWGKHLLLKFNDLTLRVHFLMFGSYTVSTPKPGRSPRLAIYLENGEALFLYACAITTIEGPVSRIYDWSADVMSSKWNPEKAKTKLRKHPNALICDALLDQEIFSGVGNIIKNEVLFRMRVHPLNKVEDIPIRRLKAIVEDAREYSFLFLKWKRAFVLKKHWQAHARKKCPRDGHTLTKIYPGVRRRRAFFCDHCQELFVTSPSNKPAVISRRENKLASQRTNSTQFRKKNAVSVGAKQHKKTRR